MLREQVAELLARNNMDAHSALAWCLGYIDNLERSRNACLETMGRKGDFTLRDDLSRAIGETQKGNRNLTHK